MLVDECQAAGVQIRTDCSVQRIEHGSDGFRVHTTHGLFHCASLVVATGGLSIPSMGPAALAMKWPASSATRCCRPAPGWCR